MLLSSSRKRWVDTVHVIGTQTRRETQEGDVEYQVREECWSQSGQPCW